MSAPVEVLAATLPFAIRAALAGARDPVDARTQLDAVVLVADISGFTTISADLASLGAAGPEELSRLLNRSFGALVELVALYGGDVVSFAGDAFVAIWPAEADGERALRLAASFALVMPSATGRPEDMPPGAPEIRLRAGIAMGPVLLAPVAAAEGRWKLVVAGAAVAHAAAIQREAAPGQTAITDGVARRLGNIAQVSPLRSGALLVSLSEEPATAPLRPDAPPPELASRLRPFVPEAILGRLEAGLSAWVAELRPVTVVFVRLPGFSVAEPPPSEALQQLARVVTSCLSRLEGVLDKFGVDEKGLFVLAGFGLPPLSHEDDALRGVRAALAIRDALAEEGHAATLGITTGRVFCGTLGGPSRWEYTMLGDVVNRSARLMQRASLGEVLCDEATRVAVGGRVAWEALEPVQLKGMRAPLAAFRPVGILAPQSGGGRRESLVGRDAERALLRAGLERVQAGQGGELVVVRGEAGIGKSRLLGDLRATAETMGLRVVGTSADSIERLTPYHAWRPVFGELLGVRGRASREAARRRLPSLLGEESAPLLPLLEVVLLLGLPQSAATQGMNPEARADRTRALLVELLGALAEQSPLVLVLDEVHWLDSASWLLLAEVAANLPGLHLVIGTRPLDGEREASLERMLALPRARLLELGPLAPEAQIALAAAVLGVDVVPPAMVRALIARAQGNPFYTAELALALQANRAEVEDGSPWQTLAPSSLPTSVEGALASRIDRLAPGAQVALKAASVFGRPFTVADLLAIHPVSDTPASLERTLSSLHRAGLVQPVVEQGEERWTLSSALVRDAAYGLMTFAQRKSLHAAVAVRMEGSRAEGHPVDLPVLAFHWTRAEVTDRAVAALDEAGEEASRYYALEEMRRFFLKALALAPDAPPGQRSRWLLRVGLTRLRVGLPSEARGYLLEALGLRGHHPPETPKKAVFPLLLELARQGARRVLPRSWLGRVSEDRLDARLWLELGWSEYFRVEPVFALYAILRAVNAAEVLGPCYERTVGSATLSAFASLAGLRGPARRWRRLALEGVEATGEPATGGSALGVLGAGALARADWPDARDLLERARELDAAAGLVEDRDLAQILLGQAALAQGALDEAERLGQEAQAAGDRRGSPIVRVRSRFFLGSVALARGDAAAAIRPLREASSVVDRGLGLDVASDMAAKASGALAAILGGDAEAGAGALRGLVGDPRLIVAAGAPALRLGEVVGLGLLLLAERDPPAWQEPASRFLLAFRRRTKNALLHAPTAARLWGRALWLEGRKKEAHAVWAEGAALAARHGMAVERALIAQQHEAGISTLAP